MKKFFEKSRKGFTLVELLIVIIILGALSATVMLTAGNSVAAAKANTIIANMTTVKNAAMMFYSAHPASSLGEFYKATSATSATSAEGNNNSTISITGNFASYLGDFKLGEKQGSATFTVVYKGQKEAATNESSNTSPGESTENASKITEDLKKWYVKAIIYESDEDREAIKKYLKNTAGKSQLLAKNDGNGNLYGTGAETENNSLSDEVYMQIK